MDGKKSDRNRSVNIFFVNQWSTCFHSCYPSALGVGEFLLAPDDSEYCVEARVMQAATSATIEWVP